MLFNSFKLITYKINITPIIFIEDIDKIIKGALEVSRNIKFI